ncbi:MAG: NAD(P)/FAD-dependent oxidoreductase [Candidatus Cryptobacteroides sp.]
MPRPARKMMISGKGRCNFTNMSEWSEFSTHIKTKADFLKPAFFSFGPGQMMDLLEDCGCPCVVERGNRAFPRSHKAADVVDALQRKVLEEGAELRCDAEVSQIAPEQPGPGFRVTVSDGTVFTSRKVIIATGGLSYPGSGSTGDGYAWAKSFGHRIVPRFPSLTAIVPKGYKVSVGRERTTASYAPYRENVYEGIRGHIDRSVPLTGLGESLKGLQLRNVRLSVECDGTVAGSEFGDLDFTDGGLEGPLGFRLSRSAVKTLANGGRVKLHIDLKPAVEPAELESRIESLWKGINDDPRSWTTVRGRKVPRPYKDRFKVLLAKLLPSELIRPFTTTNPGLDTGSLGQCLKNWTLDAEGFVGYERCVVTAGGVCLNEVRKKTLESSMVPGLYFCGEILDLDADTGGYNLQTAFSTGFLAGLSAASSLSQD